MEDNKLSFAAAMQRLDAITKELNQPGIELEKAMELFKEGLALVRQSQEQLNHFEKEVSQLIEENGVR